MGVPLIDPWFEAQFYGKIEGDDSFHLLGSSIDGAQGLFLWCPCGYGKAEFPLGGGKPHGLIIPFANPRNAPPCPPEHGPRSRDKQSHPRWQMSGAGLHDLTLAPSIDVGDPSCWHAYITNGVVG